MKENDNIDQWLRKSMEGFSEELSGAARERFFEEAPVKGRRSTVNGRLYGTLAIALLLTVTAIIWWASELNENSSDNTQKENTTILKQTNKADKPGNSANGPNSKQKIVNPLANTGEIENTKAETKTHNIADNNSTLNESEYKSIAVTASSNRNSIHSISSVKSGAESIDETSLKKPARGDVNADQFSEAFSDNTLNNAIPVNTLTGQDLISTSNNIVSESSAIKTDDLLPAGTPVKDTNAGIPIQEDNTNKTRDLELGKITSDVSSTGSKVVPYDASDGTPEKKEKKLKQGHRFMNQTLSLYYRPEIVWNVIDNEKLLHNFGAEWQTRLFSGNYLLGTGLGISLTRGYYEYAIEYNEFLGNYQQLDSITFDWNPREFSMQHTVHTSEETVFDTAVKVNTARVYRDFVYLQIPLTMGYDLVNKPKYSVGVRFIPILSVLLSKKPVDFRYEAGNDRIVQINRITPDRVRTNWQLNAGINYSRRFTETFWMELEPRFTYYFNSVYEKSDNSSSPMGASIRVAVGIKY
jgi:hypothetical protein